MPTSARESPAGTRIETSPSAWLVPKRFETPDTSTIAGPPAPTQMAAHLHDPLLADLSGEDWTKPVPPEPDGLAADVDPALGQEIFDVAIEPWLL